jgi:hypothetical protein
MVRNSIKPPLGSELGYPSRKRDTSAACRDKAAENLMQAVRMAPGHHRSLLERSAAAWSMRAAQLQRDENRAALELPVVTEAGTEHVRR